MELTETLFLLLSFLLPPLVYCLVLSLVNRRPHPVVVAGTWDLLGVVLALSGFLLVGGPTILGDLTSAWPGPRPPGGDAGFRPRPLILGVLLGLYFVGLAVGVAVALRRRRAVTSVYNVDPPVFDEVLGQALDQLGFPWTQAGNRIYLSAREEQAVLEVEPFPPLHHVTLRWGPLSPATRQEIEGELVRGLAAVYTRPNPVSDWFALAAASVLLLLTALAVLFLVLARFLGRG